MRTRAVEHFLNTPAGSDVSGDVISLHLDRSCLCALSGDLYVTFNSCYNLNNKRHANIQMQPGISCSERVSYSLQSSERFVKATVLVHEQVKECDMGEVHSMHGREEECI
jgi:hypothetical protein